MAEKRMMDKMLELGLGLAAYGEEKVSGFLKDVTAKGEVKHKDAEKLKEDIKKKGELFRKEFTRRVKKEVESAMKAMNLASAKEVAALKKKIEDLESRLEK